MKNHYWHFEVKNKASDSVFRTVTTGATYENALKRAHKGFPERLYTCTFLGQTTRVLPFDCPISLLDKTVTV